MNLRNVQKKKEKKLNDKVSKTDNEWKSQLSSEEYSICRKKIPKLHSREFIGTVKIKGLTNVHDAV